MAEMTSQGFFLGCRPQRAAASGPVVLTHTGPYTHTHPCLATLIQAHTGPYVLMPLHTHSCTHEHKC